MCEFWAPSMAPFFAFLVFSFQARHKKTPSHCPSFLNQVICFFLLSQLSYSHGGDLEILSLVDYFGSQG